jgi:hypothetical protein
MKEEDIGDAGPSTTSAPVRVKEEDIGDAGPSAAPTPVRVKEEDVGSSAGPSRTATVINIDIDSYYD